MKMNSTVCRGFSFCSFRRDGGIGTLFGTPEVVFHAVQLRNGIPLAVSFLLPPSVFADGRDDIMGDPMLESLGLRLSGTKNKGIQPRFVDDSGIRVSGGSLH